MGCYICKKCGKKFNQKGYYSKHVDEKISCINEREIKKLLARMLMKKLI